MPARMEVNITERMAAASKGIAAQFGDDGCTFSKKYILHVKSTAFMMSEGYANKMDGLIPFPEYISMATTYYGEIIRRKIGGEWVLISDFLDYPITCLR